MSTNYTVNYHLNQWEPGDKVLRTDFNEDNAKIDAAVKAEADALTQAMAAKADKSELNSLIGIVSSHTGSLDKKGNCRIWTSSYVGDGSTGTDASKTFYFPGKPLFVAICETGSERLFLALQGIGWGYCFRATTVTALRLSWSGTSMSINDSAPEFQFNGERINYSVMALLAADG